jgi:hypothetical protein
MSSELTIIRLGGEIDAAQRTAGVQMRAVAVLPIDGGSLSPLNREIARQSDLNRAMGIFPLLARDASAIQPRAGWPSAARKQLS